MAHRRAVERAARRRTVTDRVLIIVVSVAAASGLMSVLPAASQVAVGRMVCRIGSLGLGSCGNDPAALTQTQLAPPRCAALAALDASLPEVRVSETVTPTGLRIQTRTARSGDAVLHLGPDRTDEPPLLLAGEQRGQDEVLPGVVVQRSADWFLPGGQGGDIVVAAAVEEHRQWLQQRSSLAPLSAVFGSGGRDMPSPTLRYSRVWPAQGPLPTPSTSSTIQPAATDRVVARSDVSAHLLTNEVEGDSILTVSLTGTWGGGPVSGAASWRRAASGQVQAVTVAVVAARPLVKGTPAGPTGSAEVAYVTIPIASDVERRLVESWLSRPDGFGLPLTSLLGLRQPDRRDQLAAFLTRAATVTVLRYANTDRLTLTRVVTEQIARNQRVARPELELRAAYTVAPQPNGAARTLSPDPACANS